jgi:plasmid stabilization system protein ParE
VTVRLTSAARADLVEALRWYRRRGRGLDRRFLEAFDSAIRVISQHPELGPTVEGDVRRCLLSGFPYAIFYLVRDSKVIVIGCMHGARDPQTWPQGGAA